jgi:hypothetical protein
MTADRVFSNDTEHDDLTGSITSVVRSVLIGPLPRNKKTSTSDAQRSRETFLLDDTLRRSETIEIP